MFQSKITVPREEAVSYIKREYSANPLGYTSSEPITLPAPDTVITYDNGARRYKPANPLLSPTALGPHVTQVLGNGLWETTATKSYYKWPDGNIYYDVTDRYVSLRRLDKYNDFYLADPPWIQNLRENITDLGFDWYTECAELPQTVKMFMDIGHRISDGYKALRRGKLSRISPNASLKSIPSSILMYNFGIAPLMNTASELLDAVAEPRTAYKRVKTGGDVYAEELLGGILTQKEISVRAGCMVRFDRSYNPYMNTGNLISTAWELVPWSWAIDYFLPIGGYLSARCIPEGIVPVGIYQTRKEKFLQTEDYSRDPADVIHRPFHYQSTWERKVYANIPPPPLPKFKLNPSVRQLTNLFSALILRLT